MGTLNKIRLSTLVQIAAGGFLAGSTALYLVQKTVQHKVRKLPHYIESLRIVAEHDKAKSVLGPPIQVGSVDLSDRRSNYVDQKTSMLMIPLTGSMAGGIMEVRAVRDSPEGEFATALIKLHLDDGVVTIYDNGRWPAPPANSS